MTYEIFSGMLCMMQKACLFILCIALLSGCGKKEESASKIKGLPKGAPVELSYENMSVLLEDMKTFTTAVKSLDQQTLNKIDQAYKGVTFKLEQKPLFINVYPDAANGSIVFLVAPKDPRTGSNYVLTFDKKLPVVESDQIEIQIRTQNPDQPFQCVAQVSDSAAYMAEYQQHDILATYILDKKFLQSGSYDFDALSYASYRQKGIPFVVFDFMKVELQDRTANLKIACR